MGVLYEEEIWTQTYAEERLLRHRERMAIYKPKTETEEEINPADPWDF